MDGFVAWLATTPLGWLLEISPHSLSVHLAIGLPAALLAGDLWQLVRYDLRRHNTLFQLHAYGTVAIHLARWTGERRPIAEEIVASHSYYAAWAAVIAMLTLGWRLWLHRQTDTHAIFARPMSNLERALLTSATLVLMAALVATGDSGGQIVYG